MGTWTGKLSRFRLHDNYLRFYLKYILPNRDSIDRGIYELRSLSSLPEWWAILGLQFENLVLNSRQALHEILRIDPQDILKENPYFQRTTRKIPGCQIDYMIQTRFGSLYECEIRFSKDPVGAAIIPEVRAKMAALGDLPGLSHRPVLIHVNGVTRDVVDSGLFSDIIDARTLLCPGSAQPLLL